MSVENTAVEDGSGRGSFRARLRAMNSTTFWVDLAQTLGPALLICILAVLLTLHFVRPAPPTHLIMGSGPAGSRFHQVAERYQKILAENGITLDILETEGSLDNFDRLTAAKPSVDIALVATGTAGSADPGNVVSLGSMFYVPLIVFYRNPAVMQRLSQLQGQRVAIGPEGSGTRMLALALLKANEIDGKGSTRLLDLEGEAARKALLNRQADAIFLMGDSASSDTIQEMLHADGIRLYEFPQADAYVRRFHYLNKLELPPGSFDLGENLPAERINMLAPTAELLAHSDLHPALSDLLIECATEVHGRASVLQNAGEFPTPLSHDLPISADAARYYKSGKSFAYRYLPFWIASLLDRAVVVVLPIVLVVIPALRYVPAAYNWRVQSRINRRYHELMALERQTLGSVSPEERAALLTRLAQIEKAVIALKIPGSHAQAVYALREHMKFVHDKLAQTDTAAAHPA